MKKIVLAGLVVANMGASALIAMDSRPSDQSGGSDSRRKSSVIALRQLRALKPLRHAIDKAFKVTFIGDVLYRQPALPDMQFVFSEHFKGMVPTVACACLRSAYNNGILQMQLGYRRPFPEGDGKLLTELKKTKRYAVADELFQRMGYEKKTLMTLQRKHRLEEGRLDICFLQLSTPKRAGKGSLKQPIKPPLKGIRLVADVKVVAACASDEPLIKIPLIRVPTIKGPDQKPLAHSGLSLAGRTSSFAAYKKK